MESFSAIELRRNLDKLAQQAGDGQPILISKHGKNMFGMVPAEWAKLIDQVLRFDREGTLIPESEWKAILEVQFKEALASEQPSLALVIERIIEASTVMQRYHAMQRQIKKK